jgi:putative hemolysin
VEELLEITFPDHGVETLNGFIINQIHRIPEEHEVFDVLYQGYCFHICDVNQNVIREIEVSPDRSSVET